MELKTNNQSPTLTQWYLIYLIPEKVLYHEDSDDGGFILIHSSKAATTGRQKSAQRASAQAADTDEDVTIGPATG